MPDSIDRLLNPLRIIQQVFGREILLSKATDACLAEHFQKNEILSFIYGLTPTREKVTRLLRAIIPMQAYTSSTIRAGSFDGLAGGKVVKV